MAHSPEAVEEFVCENCHITHAGTPIHRDDGGHEFQPPESCGGCGGTEFVRMADWVHHHE